MPRPRIPVGCWGNITQKETPPASGKWRATARFRDFDGRTRTTEAWGPSGAKAVARLRMKMQDRAAPAGDEITPDTRLDRLAAIWLAEIATSGKVQQQTLDLYRYVVEREAIPRLGGLTVREATPGRLDAHLKGRAAARPGQARNLRAVLSGMFGLAVRHDAIPVNPVASVAALPGTQKAVRALTVEELAALRKVVAAWQLGEPQKGHRRAQDLLDVVDIMAATGARIGEVLAVRWSDIDLGASKPTLTVAGTIVRVKGEGLRWQDHPKTASGRRTVVLPQFAVDTLLRLKINAQPNPYDVVFPSSTGTLRDPHNLRRQWRDARLGTGFEWVTPHSFRRTVATLVDRSRGSKDAAAQLGHSGVGVTEQFYIERTHIAPDLADVLEQLAPQNDGDSTH